MVYFKTEPSILDYILSHSETPSSHCDSIEAHTKENFSSANMLSGAMVGSFLGALVRLTCAKRVLEIGTFTGYSALAMAEQMPDTGQVFTLEKDEKCAQTARKFWSASSHGKKIHLFLGEALEQLKKINELQQPFDLIFIDADKGNYLSYLKLCQERLNAPPSCILVDNVLWSGRVADPNNKESSTESIRQLNDYVADNPKLHGCLLPLRDGLFLIQKIS